MKIFTLGLLGFNMTDKIACNAILSQFRSSWKMLRQAISTVPNEYWNKAQNEWTFSDTIYHVLITQEFYFRDSPKGMEWGRLYGQPQYKINNPEKYYPSKEVLIEYQAHLEKQITEYLESLSDYDLTRSDGFKSYLPNIHVKLLYLLRHNAHHIGEITRMHREWGLERIIWQ